MHQPLGQLAYAAIDFESAGAAPGETDYPVQIGIVRVANLNDPHPELFSRYLACNHPVRWSASRIHGITTEMLTGAPSLISLWPEIHRLMSDCIIVGHNPSTEMRFLRIFPGHGFGPWLDTLALCRHAIPGAKDYSLGNLCSQLGIEKAVKTLVPEGRWHQALYDAAASLVLLRTLAEQLDMGQSTLAALPFAIKQG